MINEIKETDYFKKLSKNEQEQILSGREATFKMQHISFLDYDIESAVYNLLSNSVHSLPMGLGSYSPISNVSFSSFFDWFSMLVISLKVCIIYSSNVILDYLKLRKKLYVLLTQEDKAFVKQNKNADSLLEFIDIMKSDYKEFRL